MNKNLELKGLAVSFCIFAFFACNQKAYSADTLTVLPFSYMEWASWQGGVDLGETENDGRYKKLNLSRNKDLRQLMSTIDIRAVGIYFILKNDKTDCAMYVTISSQENAEGLFFNLLNIRDNKIIASLSLGSDSEERKKAADSDVEERNRTNFNISKDLKVTLFNEKLVYIEEAKLAHIEGEAISNVVERKKVGTYQIQKNCQIVKEK
jgi:hypothetical protein